MDVKSGPSALLSLTSLMVLLADVCTKSVSPSSTVSTGQELRPRVVKRSILDCDGTFENYCLNNGQCMLLVDLNEHHCKCELGFYGPRCSNLELVTQPVVEEHTVATVFCVILLLIGLAGALYFFYKWYKKNSRKEVGTEPTALERNFPSFVMKHFITAGAQTLVLVGYLHRTNIDQI